MSIKSRLIAIIKAAASVRKPASPAPAVMPVFAMTILEPQDDILSQVARLRDQGYSLRAVSAELNVSYRQARKLAAAVEAPVVW